MITNKTIAKALNTLAPNAEWNLIGDNYEDIEWLNDDYAKPSSEVVIAEINNPTPAPEPTIQEKLASVGVNLDDLKTALGL